MFVIDKKHLVVPLSAGYLQRVEDPRAEIRLEASATATATQKIHNCSRVQKWRAEGRARRATAMYYAMLGTPRDPKQCFLGNDCCGIIVVQLQVEAICNR